MTDKEMEEAKEKFGKLMFRHAIIARTINEYQKEFKDVSDQIDNLFSKITGVEKDGSTICEKK